MPPRPRPLDVMSRPDYRGLPFAPGDAVILNFQSLAVYSALVGAPHLSTQDIARRVKLSVDDVRAHLEQLTTLGLLSVGPDRLTFGAVHPQVGLARLAERASWQVQQRMAEAETTNRVIGSLLADLAHPRADAKVEAVDRASVPATQDLLLRQAQGEISILSGGSWREWTTSSPTTLATLDQAGQRGLRVRIVTDHATADDAELLALVHVTGSGQALRRDPAVPVSMTLVDSSIALVSREDDRETGAASLIRHPSLVAAMAGLFESIWDAAGAVDISEPSRAPARQDPDLSADQVRTLRLLASGMKDEAVARTLGLSVRSLTRRLAATADQLQVTTRFQAGAEASRRGLV